MLSIPPPAAHTSDELVFLQPVEYNSYFAGACISWRRDASGGEWQPHYRITDHLGSTRLETSSNGTITAAYDYKPFGEQIPLMTTKTRKTYIGKERDDESYLGDFGVRKYDYAAGRFTAPDVLWEKYMGWSPYQYCMNNPISLLDFNGKNAGMKIVGNDITIVAVYVTPNTNAANNIDAANKFLNEQNYSVSEGKYAGYTVHFQLKGIANNVETDFKDPDNFNEGGINIGNKYEVRSEYSWKDDKEITQDFEWHNGTIHGGQTFFNKEIVMNQKVISQRNIIHEIFHTIFFNNDGGLYGIGNYNPGTDMPIQEDINSLVNSPLLKEIP